MLLSLLLPPLVALSGAHPQDDIKPVYLEHCAKCHGESGDGDGTADLERPARSFLDGGYSYGNTPGAIQRSIRHGIPGTAMPAFKESLSTDEIAQLAKFVASLGPEGTVVEPGSSILAVTDRPLCVRGMMPAAGEGEQRTPRSLVVGFPNGTTFHYDATTCGLLAMYVGDFLDRRDWMDRGGAALRPLGTEVLRTDAAASAAAAIMAGDAVLARSVRRTHSAENSVRIDFDLANDAGEIVGGGQEFLSFLDVDGVPVAQRALVAFAHIDQSATFRPLDGDPVATLGEDSESSPTVLVRPVQDGVFALDVEGFAGIRTFIYAETWTDGLESAVESSFASEEN